MARQQRSRRALRVAHSVHPHHLGKFGRLPRARLSNAMRPGKITEPRSRSRQAAAPVLHNKATHSSETCASARIEGDSWPWLAMRDPRTPRPAAGAGPNAFGSRTAFEACRTALLCAGHTLGRPHRRLGRGLRPDRCIVVGGGGTGRYFVAPPHPSRFPAVPTAPKESLRGGDGGGDRWISGRRQGEFGGWGARWGSVRNAVPASLVGAFPRLSWGLAPPHHQRLICSPP